MFESGEEAEVSGGLALMNELVVPCIPLLLAHDAPPDLLAVEDMRNRWCSYLGQDMEGRFPGGPTGICSGPQEGEGPSLTLRRVRVPSLTLWRVRGPSLTLRRVAVPSLTLWRGCRFSGASPRIPPTLMCLGGLVA